MKILHRRRNNEEKGIEEMFGILLTAILNNRI